MDARTRFLVSASQAYARTVPAAAAHLQLYSNELPATDDARRQTQLARNACQSCGSILIPGLSSRITVVESQAKISRHISGRLTMKNGRKGNNGSRQDQSPKLLRNECTKCGRYKETALPQLERTKSSVQHKENSATSQVLDSHAAGSIAVGDKRSRSRRKGGLKALLAGAKETARPSTSLELMDFMKSA